MDLMMDLQLLDLSIEVIKKNIKHIYLRIYSPTGQVRVTVPKKMSTDTIHSFITSKLKWIKDRQKKMQARLREMPPQVKPDANELKRRALLDAQHKQQLYEKLRSLIPEWEKKMNVSVTRFSIRKMRTRWGSCSPTSRTIRFNLALANKLPECIEYVVVHELAHLIEPSHNAHFVALMDKFLPRWRAYRQELNKVG